MTDLLRSARFRREREPAWLRAEVLVTKAEKGVGRMTYPEVLELSDLYQQVVNALSVARAISMDAALLAYLEALSARAYLVIHAPQESLSGLLTKLIRQDIPQTVRRAWVAVLIAFVALALGTVTAAVLVGRDPSWFYTFVPPGMGDGRTPDASTDYLRSTLYGEADGAEMLSTFASFLFTHNTQIAIMIFAVGIFAMIPSFVLTFYNGLMVGAFWMAYHRHGLGYEVTGWLSIHGVTELTAVVMACAGGCQMGLAVILPGEMTRRAALKARGRDAVRLFGLAAIMLIVAAGIEGFLRQIVQSTEARLAIGWGMGAVWATWLGLSGRRT
jgi:uncharacterized membrane protein SpoIIM required for sporulation